MVEVDVALDVVIVAVLEVKVRVLVVLMKEAVTDKTEREWLCDSVFEDMIGMLTVVAVVVVSVDVVVDLVRVWVEV